MFFFSAAFFAMPAMKAMKVTKAMKALMVLKAKRALKAAEKKHKKEVAAQAALWAEFTAADDQWAAALGPLAAGFMQFADIGHVSEPEEDEEAP